MPQRAPISSLACSGPPPGRKKKSLSRRRSSGISPATILWALEMMRLCMDCRKTSFNCTVGNIPAAIRSPSTFPAPTDGSWSLSPTSISLHPMGRARSTLSKTYASTMDISSITRHSHSKGLRSLRLKKGWSRSSQSTWSIRWMVFDSSPVSSLILFAARPVGAANKTRSPACFSMRMMAFRVVVLPVPGPPVSISTPCSMAAFIASRCLPAYSMPSRSSMALMCMSAPAMALAGARSMAFMRPAMYCSQRCCCCRNRYSLPPNSSCMSTKLPQSSSTASSASSRSTPRSFAATFISASRGTQVWPLFTLCRITYTTPACTRLISSWGRSMDWAIWSAA